MADSSKTYNRQLFLFFWFVFLTPVFAVTLLMMYFMQLEFLLPLLIVSYLLLTIFLFWRGVFRRYRKQTVLLGLILGGGAIVYAINGTYHHLMPIVEPTNVDLFSYQPFTEGTKAVELSEEATLKLTDPLPRIDGATAFYPTYASFVQMVYPEKEYHPYDSEVMSNRTGIAYDLLITGDVDIIFAFGPSDEQLQLAKEFDVELELTPIGKEAFVFFVHEKNPLENIRTTDLQKIYTGEITNWKEVGGKNQSIRAFQRDKNSGSQTALERFMGDLPMMDPPTEDIATLMGTMIDVVKDYKNYRNALGFTFRYYATDMVKDQEIRLLSVDGVPPTLETVESGEYPIIDEFYAITAGTDNPNVERLIEWILSDQGQRIVRETGYAPIRFNHRDK